MNHFENLKFFRVEAAMCSMVLKSIQVSEICLYFTVCFVSFFDEGRLWRYVLDIQEF